VKRVTVGRVKVVLSAVVPFDNANSDVAALLARIDEAAAHAANQCS
jgi:hypothetical protein